MGEFKPGDLVCLKSGGPRMTVEGWDEDYQQFLCTWFNDDGSREYGRFAVETLEKVD